MKKTSKTIGILTVLCLSTMLFSCTKDKETYRGKDTGKVSVSLNGAQGNALADAPPSTTTLEKTEAGDGNDYWGVTP